MELHVAVITTCLAGLFSSMGLVRIWGFAKAILK